MSHNATIFTMLSDFLANTVFFATYPFANDTRCIQARDEMLACHFGQDGWHSMAGSIIYGAPRERKERWKMLLMVEARWNKSRDTVPRRFVFLAKKQGKNGEFLRHARRRVTRGNISWRTFILGAYVIVELRTYEGEGWFFVNLPPRNPRTGYDRSEFRVQRRLFSKFTLITDW